MILETTTALLGLLVVYHVYRSVWHGHDFIGDLARQVLHIVAGTQERMKSAGSQIFIHPSYTGVNTRRVASDSLRLPQIYDLVGPKKTDGMSLAEMAPPMGMPVGLPRPTNGVDNLLQDSLHNAAAAAGQPQQEPMEPSAFNAGSEFGSWYS